MRSLDAAELAAIQARAVVARDLLWITAPPFGGGAAESFGFSTMVRTVGIDVRDGLTGATVNRSFYGIGAALKIGPIPLTADITVRTVDVEVPAIDAVVAQVVRGHDVRNAPVQVYRAYLDPDTRALLAPAKPRFIGTVDAAPIETPAAGGVGSVRLTLASSSRELTRSSPDVCSHESQLARSGGTDDFYIDTAVVADWEIYWGRARAGGGVSPNGGAESKRSDR